MKAQRSGAAERGGFLLGMIVGLLLGLALALGVALYVTKVPVPFVDRLQHRTAEQDAAEAERNKSWDPNAPLGSHNAVPAPPVAAASRPVPPLAASEPGVSASSAVAAAPSRPPASRPVPPPPRDPAAILAGEAPPATSPPPTASTKSGSDPLIYFVQTGAFARSEDADQQRARLAMEGLAARVTAREQNGRTLYRVRLGPFDSPEDADAMLERVRPVAPPATIVRTVRSAG